MANYVVSDTNLTLIADAIRAKSGHNELLEWPNEYKTSIDNLNPVDMCIKTVTDNIVSVSDAAQYDAKNATIKIEPVQDLHGYDSPWPAGGRKNLYNSATFPSQTKSGITCTNNGDGSFTLNGTATTDVFFDVFTTQFNFNNDGTPLPSAEYRLTGCPSGGSSQTYYLYTIPNYHADYGRGTTFTDKISGGSIFVKSGVTVNNLIFNPMIRLASNDDDTFAPYSNICPISGWTGANVTRTGKNLLSPLQYVFQTKTQNGITYEVQSDGSIHATGTATAIGGPTLCNNFELPNGTYSYLNEMENHIHCAYRKRNKSSGSTSALPNPFTVDGSFEIYINVYCNSTGTFDYYLHPQLELGSTATDYEPYQGDTYDIAFPSEAGTVYGGTLDVTNGVLTVDRAMWMKNTAYMDNTDNTPGWKSSGIKDFIGANINREFANAMTNIGTYWSANTNGSNDIVFLRTARYGKTQSEWQALAIDVQIVVPLATPITYQLTPQEIALLRGNNTLWADTGDVTLKYFTTAFEDLAEEIGFAEGGDY